MLTQELQIAESKEPHSRLREFLDKRVKDTIVIFQRIRISRNRMREIRSSGSVGERGGNKPLYPETGNLEQMRRPVPE